MSGVKDKKMRIAFIQPEYANYRLPFYETFQVEYNVDFLFLNQSSSEPNQEYIKHFLSVYELDQRKVFSGQWFPPRKNIILLLSTLLNNKYPIIVTANYSPPTLIALLTSKITSSKYLVWVEDWFSPHPKSFKSKVRFFLFDLIAKCCLANASAVVVEGSAQRRSVSRFGVPSEKVFQANHSSLDYSKFKSLNLRQKLKVGNAFVILYVGRIIEQKGLDVLIEAFSKLEQENKDAYLFVIGDGNFRGFCESIVKKMQLKHVVFIGTITEENEKASFYETADVLVLPSRIVVGEELAEGWGLVINEAMSMGKPVITTDAVGAAEDLVRNGVNGYVVKNGDVEDLYFALRKIVKSSELKKTMEVNSRMIFQEFNGFDKMFNGFKRAIEYCRQTSQ